MQAAQERRGAVSRRSVCGIRTSAAPSTTARKKAEAFAATFEKECREGVTSDSRMKFEEYCEYVLELKEGLVPFNVAGKASLPKITHKEVNYFQPEDIADIRSALEDEPIKWRTLTHMLLITGARRGEILGLKWCNVDFDNSRIVYISAIMSSIRPISASMRTHPKPSGLSVILRCRSRRCSF